MSDVVIKVESLGKKYRLGKVGRDSFIQDFKHFWRKLNVKENLKYETLQVINESSNIGLDWVWAINDLNFEIKKGEIFGVIGRNGAGKSTLLKILSRITQPTTGLFKVKGRLASLLEVGTGFHPDLSGRENIFLNGAILGMTKNEIHSNLEEIIDFSGIEKYIDTPVKRYSSGMYVRLAFAVAAHLNPEILIVDEVLAVGDLEFQKKCLGKMQDVSKNRGKTVLFVSHNLSAVRNLCTKSIVLSKGNLAYEGVPDDAINFYNSTFNFEISDNCHERTLDENLNLPVQFKRISLIKQDSSENFALEFVHQVGFIFEIIIRDKKPDYVIGILIQDEEANLICVSTSEENGQIFLENKAPGFYLIEAWLPCKLLKPGKYQLIASIRDKKHNYQRIENCLNFDIVDTLTYRGMKNLYRKSAIVAPEISWNFPIRKM